MIRFIALLRGINVGGSKKVPMAQLRTTLERAGFTEVATLLQSGNVVVSSAEKDARKVGKKLEAAIAKEFGFEVDVIVRSRAELEKVIKANPLEGAEEDPSHFLVLFLSEAPDAAKLEKLSALAAASEELALRGRELYAKFPNGLGRSKLAAALTGPKLGVIATGRNWATVLKLHALAKGAASGDV